MTERIVPGAGHLPAGTPLSEGKRAPSGVGDRLIEALLIGLAGAVAAGAVAWAWSTPVATIIGAAILGYLAVAALGWLAVSRPGFVRLGYGVSILLWNGFMIVALLVSKPMDILTMVCLLAFTAYTLWLGVWWIRRGMRAEEGLAESSPATDQATS